MNKNKQIKEVDNNNDEKHKEKQKFIKFLENKYIIKMKFINEIKNFGNKLKVARDNSISFNDALKTIKNKLQINLKLLNSQLDILIKQEFKFSSFISLEENINKKFKKIIKYQKISNEYLLSKYNNAFKENQKEKEKK